MAIQNLKNESGRSMVEMLGVLAIIGVLSIGAIVGYSYGMDKYRANETINDIMNRAIDLITQATRGQESLTLSGWQDEETIYDIGSEDYTYDNLIVFDVGTTKPLPETVCKMVYDALKTQAIQIDVNAERVDSHELCGNDNTMTFYFDYGSFSPDDCKNDSDCGDGRYCDADTGICFWGG